MMGKLNPTMQVFTLSYLIAHPILTLWSLIPVAGLRRSENVEHGRINLIMGNMKALPVTKIVVYTLSLSSGFSLDLNKCCYSPEMARNIISFHALYNQGFTFSFDNEVGSINAFFNNVLYFKALPCDGVYETLYVVDNLGNNVLCIDFVNDNNLDKASL
uniref:Uncharacterized protein n=1 Tax=Lactuca sativa TaxID=4236 RepID=A0A9R1WUM9_LACSA|nr:hypothetical protein LSAT_V11C900490440 [Lactuca sativa]